MKSIPLWFLAALIPMVLSQLVRLQQAAAEGWLICDYAGRLATLLFLLAIPQARVIAYRRYPLQTSWWETGLWIVILVAGFPLFSAWVRSFVGAWIPHTQLGHYPAPQGWLNVFDLTAGLALVAYHEEIFFRRCARAVFNCGWGDGAMMIGLSAFLFAAYHWTTGLGNMVAVFLFGVYTMCFLRRTGALWPVVLAHFLVDVITFS